MHNITKNSIEGPIPNGSFILTAGTDELQKFVTKFGREAEAYIDPGVFSKL